MAKKKIHRLNKEWYVSDEYGHTDKVLVQKVNELIGIINHQQEVIRNFELMMKNRRQYDDQSLMCWESRERQIDI